jgi:peptide/nickel transport system permease protein
MVLHAIKRLLAGLPALLLISLFIFMVLRLVPGDPATLLVGDLASAAEVERVRTEMGLDKPLLVQYAVWLGRVMGGDLGVSFMTGEPVLGALLERFGVTAQIVLLAFAIAALLAIPIGVIAARLEGSGFDVAVMLIAGVLISIPSFWTSLLLILFFGVRLEWLPSLGFVSIAENAGEWLRHAALPICALALVETAVLVRLVRASAIEVLSQDYVTYARAKGLPEWLILVRHTLRNALAPAVTMMGLMLASLLAGAVAVETVFGIPGLGRFMVDAIYARDYPVIQGTLLFIVVLYTLINLAVDCCYPLLDPKVRRE